MNNYWAEEKNIFESLEMWVCENSRRLGDVVLKQKLNVFFLMVYVYLYFCTNKSSLSLKLTKQWFFLNHPFSVDYPVSTRKRKSQITAQGESNELKNLNTIEDYFLFKLWKSRAQYYPLTSIWCSYWVF